MYFFLGINVVSVIAMYLKFYGQEPGSLEPDPIAVAPRNATEV